jgi:hypothetical protein
MLRYASIHVTKYRLNTHSSKTNQHWWNHGSATQIARIVITYCKFILQSHHVLFDDGKRIGPAIYIYNINAVVGAVDTQLYFHSCDLLFVLLNKFTYCLNYCGIFGQEMSQVSDIRDVFRMCLIIFVYNCVELHFHADVWWIDKILTLRNSVGI